ncbi:hypothetical protein AKJ53_00025 [candidate division MSBL1 archaeon SCGC-AAA382F02]|uniref:Transposase n=1 Tax=candidate division MSBL1 archaeon SCGC-AAA382F02 TaxID=1698282 RepID=A0A133VJ85_9EURY|nr:hypothetical protein AKJ53_00025 [candidate division MSBL1 archaeon SCGC-AAA382F02]
MFEEKRCVEKMQTTVCGKLFPTKNQAWELDDLMRVQSSCMRYSYNRLCEGKTKSRIETDIKQKFGEINSRYRRGGYFRAKINYKSVLELVEAGNLESPEKVVFGGRENLKKRERGKISNEEWKRLRNNQLYSRGDKSKGGNLNLRFVKRNDRLYLRVNTGGREWIYTPAYLPPKARKRVLEGEEAYGVRILRENGSYGLRVNFEENHEPEVGFEKGSVGVDFNHRTIDLAVTNEQGQFKDSKMIECPGITASRKNKREWLIGSYAKEVVEYAKYWNRGLVLEKLEDVARGRRNQHEFTYNKFLEAVKRRAEREGVEVREVNPAYTSVIGRRKYAPYYHITIHQAAALVVARRGQGFSEHLRGLKTPLFEALEAGEEGENVPDRRVHSWSLWRLTRNLPFHKGAKRKHLSQSLETIGVESSGTIASTERSPGEGDLPGGETVSPGSGPSTRKVVA